MPIARTLYCVTQGRHHVHMQRNNAFLFVFIFHSSPPPMQEGSIGHDLVIRPVPADVIHPLNAEGKSVHHVVFKRDTAATDEQSDFGEYSDSSPFISRDDAIIPPIRHSIPLSAFMEPDRLQKRFRRRRSANLTDSDFMGTDQVFSGSSSSRAKRQIPHIIYPEILAIVDYDGYRLHGGDNVQVKRYFVSFWNGVDLRYRLLKGPRIRISIAGIIISRVSYTTAALINGIAKGRDILNRKYLQFIDTKLISPPPTTKSQYERVCV